MDGKRYDHGDYDLSSEEFTQSQLCVPQDSLADLKELFLPNFSDDPISWSDLELDPESGIVFSGNSGQKPASSTLVIDNNGGNERGKENIKEEEKGREFPCDVKGLRRSGQSSEELFLPNFLDDLISWSDLDLDPESGIILSGNSWQTPTLVLSNNGGNERGKKNIKEEEKGREFSCDVLKKGHRRIRQSSEELFLSNFSDDLISRSDLKLDAESGIVYSGNSGQKPASPTLVLNNNGGNKKGKKNIKEEEKGREFPCDVSKKGHRRSRQSSEELFLSNFSVDLISRSDLKLDPESGIVYSGNSGQKPASPTLVLNNNGGNKKGKKNIKEEEKGREFPCDVSKKGLKRRRQSSGGRRRCSHCQSENTPQWRRGPPGNETLCNACGIRYRSGRLVPEYRPVSSPSFDSLKHTNFQKKIDRNFALNSSLLLLENSLNLPISIDDIFHGLDDTEYMSI